MNPIELEDLEQTLPLAGSRKQADAWALVLAAEGMDPVVHRVSMGFLIEVAPSDALRAHELIATWRDENRSVPPPPEAELPTLGPTDELVVPYALFLALLVFHISLQSNAQIDAIYRAGAAHATKILDGDFWRTVTALCLHRDYAHVAGNTLVGGLFLGALTRRVGPGVAFATTLASGALGNACNALYHHDDHSSVGASTAVFGVVGILAGLEAWRRQRVALPWQGGWVPIGAGLALLAMLGSGGVRVDLGAHVFGMLAGISIGLAIAPGTTLHRVGQRGQLAAGGAALLVLALSWSLALRTIS